MFKAKMLLHSVSPGGFGLETYFLRYPKMIHAELMTYRVFSRNASSSRAVPVMKLIEEAEDPLRRAAPVFWGKNIPGMSATEELTGTELIEAKLLWEEAALQAAAKARRMHAVGMHKQVVNRILEPFTHINVVVTSNEMMNFFGQRLHHAAQPEMRELAKAMWAVRKASTPKLLLPGQWHLPYVDAQIEDDGTQSYRDRPDPQCVRFRELEEARKVSVARCARTSYLSNETGKPSTFEEDLKLYDRLMDRNFDEEYWDPLHASPAEHQATPDERSNNSLAGLEWQNPREHGNLYGWRQYRKMLPGESCAPLPLEYR